MPHIPLSPRGGEPAIPDALTIRENTPEELDAMWLSMKWPGEEIERATRRHPAAADALFHSFYLLEPDWHGMRRCTEVVHRAHCRELLDRVGAGADTRPATAVEICRELCRIGAIAPLTTTQVGLHVRMWAAAFPDQPDPSGELEHYEALHGAALDEAERVTRHELAEPWRALDGIQCNGRHDGVPVSCQYATPGRSA